MSLSKYIIRARGGEFDIEAVSLLNLSGLGLEDIRILSKCTNLVSLDLSNNCLVNLEGLETLVRLKKLNLSNNKLENLKQLEKMESLESLHLEGNLIKNTDQLWPLKNCTRLTHLYLRNITNTLNNPLLLLTINNSFSHASYVDLLTNLLPWLRVIDGQRLANKFLAQKLDECNNIKFRNQAKISGSPPTLEYIPSNYEADIAYELKKCKSMIESCTAALLDADTLLSI